MDPDVIQCLNGLLDQAVTKGAQETQLKLKCYQQLAAIEPTNVVDLDPSKLELVE